MSPNTEIIVTLLGGLAVFIFGMNLMSDGLQKVAGTKMKSVLEFLTKNPIMGVLAGAVTTAVLQSSSATTVMVIGFVSAGLMGLKQAISVIMGANIGTTITAQLIAFKIGSYAWVFVIIGFIMFFFIKKNEKISQLGQTIFGFGMLFIGINTMGDTMKPLAASQVFADLMLSVQDMPILGVALGTIMTVVVQSSSATIAVLQNLASQAGPDGITSIIGLEGAIPILFGDNIGTTITALLASIGASVNAKRTALAHTVFNLFGSIIFLFFVPQFAMFVSFISPKGAEIDIIARQIANAHITFNLLNTLIWLPFIFVLVKIVTKLVPGSDVERLPSQPLYLDYKLIEQPLFAIHLSRKELGRQIEFAKEMIEAARLSFIENSTEQVKKVFDLEEIVNALEEEISKYLSTIFTNDSLSEVQGNEISGLIHISSDIEHIGDYCVNIAEFSLLKINNGYSFSDDALLEIEESFAQINTMLNDTIDTLGNESEASALRVLEQENLVNENEKTLRARHMERISQKLCSPEFTVTFTDIIHNIEKVGDCCKNIAEAVIENNHMKKKMQS